MARVARSMEDRHRIRASEDHLGGPVRFAEKLWLKVLFADLL
jgi:hypothetical protein